MGQGTRLVFVMALLTLLATGCWDRREINELAFVSSMAFDLEGEKRILTAEIIRSAAVAGGGDAGGGGATSPARPQRSVVISSEEGDTLFGAGRWLATKLPRRAYVAHTAAVLVGEEMARRGLAEVLDFLDRHQEFRRSTCILLTRGPAANILVEAQGGLEDSLGREIAGLAKWVRVSGYGFIPNIHDLLQDLSGGGASTLIPVLEFSPQPQPPVSGRVPSGPGASPPTGLPAEPEIVRTVALDGAGLFHHDRLVGWLDRRQVRGWAWARNRVVRAVLELECPGDGSKLSVEITEVEGDIKIEAKNSLLEGVIKVKVEGNLLEQQCTHDFTTPEALQALEDRAATFIAAEIRSALEQAQEAGADVFGFGGALYRKEPRLWKELHNRWREEFSELPVTVQVEAKMRRTGLTSRPWQPPAR
ncbi:MAG TPA: hypothetical protein DEA73_04225 [Peptococcaceae bacterium]|nr:MAG: Spore germination B3 GerAC like protein [Moorella sp. 60_41]HBT47079.1 hypothetical protein [Peptococcaceae bacterium]